MSKLGKIKVAKEECYDAKQATKVCNVVTDIAISKLVETSFNFKYLIGYLDDAIKLLVQY